jgi:two-component sensor histidine kinase
VEFAEYARSLLNYLWRAHGMVAARVRLNLDLQPVPLSVETAVPCGLILNELAGNALKHAFRRETGDESREKAEENGGNGYEVQVRLGANSDGRVTLRVSDNGSGLPAGIDWRRSRSLGLRLVQMLTDQIGGTVEVLTRPGEGTQFEVTFGAARHGDESTPHAPREEIASRGA